MNYIFSAIFLYFFLGFLLYIFQRRIVFNKSGHPGAPKDYNLDNTEEIYIKTEESSENIKARVNNITYQNMTAINPYAWPIYLGPQQQKEPDGTGEGFWPNTNPYISINNITFKKISSLFLVSIKLLHFIFP